MGTWGSAVPITTGHLSMSLVIWHLRTGRTRPCISNASLHPHKDCLVLESPRRHCISLHTTYDMLTWSLPVSSTIATIGGGSSVAFSPWLALRSGRDGCASFFFSTNQTFFSVLKSISFGLSFSCLSFCDMPFGFLIHHTIIVYHRMIELFMLL